MKTLSIISLSIASLTLGTSAAIVVAPVTATATFSDNSPTLMINGSGLSTTLVTGVPVPSTYPTHDTSSATLWRTGAGTTAATITFDLNGTGNATYDLTGFHIWNYNEVFNNASFSNRGVRNATVAFSTNNAVSFTTIVPTFTFTQAPGSASYTGEDYSFASTLTGVTDVRFTVINNHGGDRVGLSEVRFVAVPEPSSTALLGLGALALAFRRRK